MPWHGEFVTLALRLPPGLLEAVGYDGDARYVALWLCGDDVVVGDGTSWRTGRWHAFEVFWGHPLGRALLGPYELEPPDHDPYLPATHRLLADRWAQTLAVGETADVEAFLTTQPNPLVALTDGLAAEEVAQLVRDALSRPLAVDLDEVQRSMAAAWRLQAELQEWLDERLAEVEGSQS